MKYNVLLTAAGKGERFKQEGFILPKPFIEINGKAYTDHVIDNLPLSLIDEIILVLPKDLEYHKFGLLNDDLISKRLYLDTNEYFDLSGLYGQAATTLFGMSYFNNETNPLLVMSIDQFVTLKAMTGYLMSSSYKAGSILTFINPDATDLKWSFCVTETSYVIDHIKSVVEKPSSFVSNQANVGVYVFRDMPLLKKYILRDKSKKYGLRGNETYIAPIYNHYLDEGHRLISYSIKRGEDFFELGTPSDYKKNVPILIDRSLV